MSSVTKDTWVAVTCGTDGALGERHDEPRVSNTGNHEPTGRR